MLKSIGVFTALATVGIGFLGNSKATATSLVVIITIRGIAFLSTKIVNSIEKNTGALVDFTAWCLCGVYIINIIKAAQSAFEPFLKFFN